MIVVTGGGRFIGASRKLRVLDPALAIFDVCRRGRPCRVRPVEGFEHDARRGVPDAGEATRLTGWKPEVPPEEGLTEVGGRHRMRRPVHGIGE
jgi:nucleoside-diphosphate-sugar epimerase